MKDPTIQIKKGEKILFRCSLWTLINIHIYEREVRAMTADGIKLLLNGEEVETPKMEDDYED